METIELQRLVAFYTQQAECLPPAERASLEAALGGPARLYALTDLGEETPVWVGVRDDGVAVLRAWKAQAWPLASIGSVVEETNLSCSTLRVLGKASGEHGTSPTLVLLRYTHRQRAAMGQLRFALEELLKGEHPTTLGWKSTDTPAEIAARADRHYAEGMLKPVFDAQATASKHGRSVLWRLLAYLKPYRVQVAWGALGAVAMTAATLVPSWVTGHLIDGVLRPVEAGRIGAEEGARLLTWLTIGVGATYALKEFFAWVRLRSMSVLGEYVAADLRREIYAHLQSLSLDFFSKRNSGSLVSRVTADTDRLWDFIAFGVVEVFVSTLMLVGIGAVLLSLDLKLGLLMCVPVPLLLGAIWWHGERMQRLFLRCWRKWSRLTAIVADTLPGIRVVKAFRREEQEKSRFDRLNAEVLTDVERVHGAWTVFWPSLMFGIHTLMLGVWVFGGPRVLGHGDPLSAGTFISFVLYAGLFAQPVEVIGQLSRMMNRAVSSAHRVFEILDAEAKVKERVDAIDPGRLSGGLRFERVSFSYDGLRSVVRDVSFEVRPGEMIGLVGSSGGGKSTLISLLARFHDVTRGAIFVDGHDLRDLNLDVYRRQVGMVLQEPYLFHGTILENIRYGKPEADLTEVVRAAQAAHVHEFVTRLPHGYDTVVGERGHTLSGGERQRVSIARALLQDPRVLILDEATSSVDTETERKIQDALDRLVKGRTTIAIAHRLSTLRKADRLLVVKEGKLAEQGTHAELVDKPDGIYRKLYELQNEQKAVADGFVSFAVKTTQELGTEAVCNS